MKLITAVILPILFLAALFGGLATVPTAAAQCTYNLNWTFDSSVPSEWKSYLSNTTMAYSGADGHTANGMMAVSSLDSNAIVEVRTADILSLLALPSGSTINSNGLQVSAWGKLNTANTTSQRVAIIHSASGWTASNLHYTNNTWGEMSVTDSVNDNLSAVSLYSYPVSAASFGGGWDDVAITIPCENVTIPATATPGATITATATPGATVTPGATAVATETPAATPTATPSVSETIDLVIPDDPGFIEAVLPGPLPLPSIEDTIDLSVFWDMNNFVGILQIVQTFFYLETIPEFLKVFLFIMSIVVGLRVVIGIVSNRASKQKEI